MKKLLIILGILLAGASMVFCQSPTTPRKIITVPFHGGGQYTFNTTAQPFGLASVDMTFVGSAQSNTFTFGYIRSNVTHTLLVQTATMKTCVWLLPAPYYFQTGDRLTWTNSVTNAAVFTANGDL